MIVDNSDLETLAIVETPYKATDLAEMGDNLPSIDLGTGRTARGVITGEGLHTCAIMDNSSIKCWGSNDSGQLGLGDTNNRGDGADEMGDNLPSISY